MSAPDFFIADNIFSVSPGRVDELHRARNAHQHDLPDDLRLRAYVYPTNFREDGEHMARNLWEMGVRELFIGLETFETEIVRSLGKEPVTEQEAVQTILLLKRFGFAVKVALLLGLPGETKASLRRTADGLRLLLDSCTAQSPEEGGLKSADISRVMPLVGTDLYNLLLSNPHACKKYLDIVQKPLSEDVCPRYPLLLRLFLEHYTSVSFDDVAATGERMTKEARSALDPKKVGGFWRPKDGKYEE